MHQGIKLRHIRAFLDIATSGGISAVARSQSVTQPALSRTLAEMEAMLGKSLFLRQGRRLVLTDEGRIYRRHAAMALQALEAGSSALSPGGQTRLRLGLLPTVAASFFPTVALRFSQHQPDCTLSIETGPHFFLMSQLREGAIDLVIGRLPRADEMAGLQFEHLYEEEVVLVARAGHPAQSQPVDAVLGQFPLILPPATALIRPAIDSFLASLGLTAQRPRLETASLALGRGICFASDWLWFISRGVVATELERGSLSELPLPTRLARGAVGITSRHAPTSPAQAILRDIAWDVAQQQLKDPAP